SQVQQVSSMIHDMNLSASDKAEKRTQLQGQLQAAETDLAVLKSQYSQVESQLAGQEAELAAKENQVSQVEAELKLMREAILSNSETSGTLDADYQAAVKAQKDCEAQLKAVRKVRNE